MSRTFLKRLRLAGMCLLALASVPTSRANESCPPCPQQCPSCPGYARTNSHECCLTPIVNWALCCDYYILPPDYGWNAPVKVPVVRRGVTYDRYWPEQWHGTGSPVAGQYRTYSQVYSPTDTTQLGYIYQQVPYWQPANRLPPPPVPSQWHVREPHRGYRGRWHGYYTPIHHHQSTNLHYWVEPLGDSTGAGSATGRTSRMSSSSRAEPGTEKARTRSGRADSTASGPTRGRQDRGENQIAIDIDASLVLQITW